MRHVQNKATGANKKKLDLKHNNTYAKARNIIIPIQIVKLDDHDKYKYFYKDLTYEKVFDFPNFING
jgi:hypothetical protein